MLSQDEFDTRNLKILNDNIPRLIDLPIYSLQPFYMRGIVASSVVIKASELLMPPPKKKKKKDSGYGFFHGSSADRDTEHQHKIIKHCHPLL